MVVAGKLYTPPGYPRSWRALIAAKYSKTHVDCVPYIPGKTNTEAEFLSKFPSTEVPVFEGTGGNNLFEINAIAHFLGNEQLRGGKNEPSVTQWVNYAESIILPAVANWVYPCIGVTQLNQKNMGIAKENIAVAMAHLNKFLTSRTFLVDESITQADITLFTALYLLFTHVYDATSRKPFPHVERWYITIANQPEVIAIAGKPKLCEKPAQFDAKKYAEIHGQGKQEPKGKQQKEKQKPEQPKSAKKQKEKEKKDDDEEDDIVQERPKENPLAKLPTGSFNLDEFKRTFSNNDIETVALPYLWEHFDPENYSIWHYEYKYPEELRLLFMTNNLVSGMNQRLEKMLKYAFASCCVLGVDKDNTISGIWIWRGTGLIFDLDTDIQTDYESFTWRKLDHKSEECKKLVHAYFTRKADINGKPIASSKIFK